VSAFFARQNALAGSAARLPAARISNVDTMLRSEAQAIERTARRVLPEGAYAAGGT
jgi:hypothetical protein